MTILFPPKFMMSAMTLFSCSEISCFLDGDVPRLTSYGVYISELFRFAGVLSHVDDFSACNKF